MSTRAYNYDAFGVEKNPNPQDENPFRYCGEYFDRETETYYLRARYYDPTIGRFTQQDTHWTTANSIYGDNPQKINEREDKLGLKTYSYAPQITAVMQSGNLYVYGVNNPVAFCDRNGCAGELALAWTGSMWWLPTIDGILPIGDIIYLGGIGVTAAIDSIGIDNIARFFDEVPNAFQQLIQQAGDKAEAISDAAQQSASGGGSGSPSGPNNWNHRDYFLKQIQNKRLRNFVSELYRADAQIGDGGTADMLRYEFDNGLHLRHLQKAKNAITHLEKILRIENLSKNELQILYRIRNDLYNAVKYVGG